MFIEGFDVGDTNRLTFYDNTATARTFPFVASLTLTFGANLVSDASAKYWVHISPRFPALGTTLVRAVR